MSDDRAWTRKINGIPGAGKTHHMLEETVQAMTHGVSLNDIGLANFTVAGREDAADELVDRLDDAAENDEITLNADDHDIRRRCRTLHSWVLGRLDDLGIVTSIEHQVIQLESRDVRVIPPVGEDPADVSDDDMLDPFRDFVSRRVLSLDEDRVDQSAEQAMREAADDSSDATVATGATANQLWRLDAWLHQHVPPGEDMIPHIPDCPVSVDLDQQTTVDELKAWWTYKQHRRELPMYQHHDYIHLALEHEAYPSLDFIAIDETQDLSPVETLLLRRIRDCAGVTKMIVAGDVNQSIYSFKGAKPQYFDGMDVNDTQYLSESRRCPEAVTDLAQQIIAESPSDSETPDVSTYDPGWGSRTGSVDRVRVTDDAAVVDAVTDLVEQYRDDRDDGDTGAVMLLARSNSYVRGVMGALQGAGVPWSMLDGWSPWSDDSIEMLEALRALHTGAPTVSKDGVEHIVSRLPDSDTRADIVQLMTGAGSTARADSVWRAMPDLDDVRSIVDAMDLHDDRVRADMLASAAVSDHGITDPELVRLGTIHSAKGLEAPAVAVLTDWSHQMMDVYRNGDDADRAEEHRVAYVAVTRARQQVSLLHGLYGAGTAPMLDADVLDRAGVLTQSQTAVTGGD